MTTPVNIAATRTDWMAHLLDGATWVWILRALSAVMVVVVVLVIIWAFTATEPFFFPVLTPATGGAR